MRILFLLMIGLFLVSGCRKDEVDAIESKCDAALRLRAEELMRTGGTATLEVLGNAVGAIDEKRRQQLIEAGATLFEVREDLFVAHIPPNRLGAVAGLDFVKSLQLSKTLEPLGK